MKLFLTAGRSLLPVFLTFALVACNESKEVAQGQVAETKATESGAPPEITESAERRRVREMLESVVLPKIDFSSTSAEEAADYVGYWIKEIAPAKEVKIVVRRPMPLDDEGRPMVEGEFCYSGHTWKAEDIPAWQALERIASDNGMTVEADGTEVRLMPQAKDGKPVALRPLEPEEE